MRERGINIATEYPKPWTDEVVQAADVVITRLRRRLSRLPPASGTRSGPSMTPPAWTRRVSGPSVNRLEAKVLSLLEQLDVAARG